VLEWVPVSRLADLPTPATDLFIYHLVLENRFFALQAEYDAAIDLLLLQDEITGQVLFRHL
jgi:8-oxo-dGTP diphosphatase